jgi:hypothetical protein
MEKKRKGIGKLLERFVLAFDPLYHYFFVIGDGIGELLKLLLYVRKSRMSIINRSL